MIKVSIVIILFTVSTCATQALEVIAHRGVNTSSSQAYPNPFLNNLYAISEAYNLNSSYIEVDLQFTKDHHIVLFHDRELENKTNLVGMVEDYTLRELKELKRFKFNKLIKVPITTFEEIITKLPNINLLINPRSDKKYFLNHLVKSLKKIKLLHLKSFLYWGDIDQYYQLVAQFPNTIKLITNKRQAQNCLDNLILFAPFLVFNFIPEACLKYSNLTFKLKHKMPYPGLNFTKILSLLKKRKINTWMLSANSLADARLANDLGFHGIITSNREVLIYAKEH